MELRVAESAYFITLTYAPENIPTVKNFNMYMAMTLDKKDLTLFLKRLRAQILKEYPKSIQYLKKSEKSQKWSPKLRYFACGEYGGKTERPHYHLILYNLPNYWVEKDKIHNILISDQLEKIWKKGIVNIGKVEQGSAHYMTQHHMFPIDERWSENDSRQRPFSTMSKKPGIGINYLDGQTINYFANTKNSYATLKNGIRQSLGRYYKEKIKEAIQNEETIRDMQFISKQYAQEQEERTRQSFRSETDFLAAKREEYKNSLKKFKRNLKKNNKL